MRTNLLVAAFLVAFPLPVASDASPMKLLPGDPQIDGTEIAAHSATYVLFGRRPDGQEQRMQEIRRDVTRDGDLIHVTWTTEVQGTAVVDQVKIDGTSLVPSWASVPTQKDNQMVKAVVTFDGLDLVGRTETLSGEELEAWEHHLEQAVFAGSTDAIILSAVSLSEGARFSWPTLAEGFDAVSWIEALVAGRESVEVGDGTIEGWRVDVTSGPVTGSLVIADKAPYVLSKEFKLPQFTIIWRLQPDSR